MKVIDIILNTKETLFSFELLPPMKGNSIEKVYKVIDPLMEYKPKTFSVDIPESLVKEARKCKTTADARQVGVEWTIQQSKELMAAGVPVIHYYTIGIPDNILKIAKEVF